MVTPENRMSIAGQHALQDMIELQMYLEARPPFTDWPMLPRRTDGHQQAREPYSNPVESSVVKELLDQGFLEATSNRTFVVSKAGIQFYERKIKPHLNVSDQGGTA